MTSLSRIRQFSCFSRRGHNAVLLSLLITFINYIFGRLFVRNKQTLLLKLRGVGNNRFSWWATTYFKTSLDDDE